MFNGVLFALTAGILWGMVFVVPLLLPDQSPALLSLGRYLAFGLVCLPIAMFQWRSLRALSRHDWAQAFTLSVVGNFVYYGFLAFSIQTLGNPLPSLIIGTLPVVIAVSANLGFAQGQAVSRVAWRRLALPFALLLMGLACVNVQELTQLSQISTAQYAWGLMAALLAVAAWTWYPLVNDRHLKQSPHIAASTWASAQGLATLLPAALMFIAILTLTSDYKHIEPAAPLGLTDSLIKSAMELPHRFWILMLVLGFACSWLGTLCWNAASQRLPAALSGQLIVFETLAALTMGYAFRGQWPNIISLTGVALLIVGVLLGVRVFKRNL